jgi:hypothetical protein
MKKVYKQKIEKMRHRYRTKINFYICHIPLFLQIEIFKTWNYIRNQQFQKI